jgi:hypothetical protein
MVKPYREIKKKITRRWLTAVDIARAANSLYDWGHSIHSIGFEVVGSPEQFKSTLLGSGGDPGLLQRLRSGEINNAVLIINQENRHWVSVVINRDQINRDQGGNLRAYWADSLGVSDVGFYTSFTQHLSRNRIHVTELSAMGNFPVQEDGYSCGAHALINAREIVRQLETNPGVSISNIVDALRVVERTTQINDIYYGSVVGAFRFAEGEELHDIDFPAFEKDPSYYAQKKTGYGTRFDVVIDLLEKVLLEARRDNKLWMLQSVLGHVLSFSNWNSKHLTVEIAKSFKDIILTLTQELVQGAENSQQVRASLRAILGMSIQLRMHDITINEEGGIRNRFVFPDEVLKIVGDIFGRESKLFFRLVIAHGLQSLNLLTNKELKRLPEHFRAFLSDDPIFIEEDYVDSHFTEKGQYFHLRAIFFRDAALMCTLLGAPQDAYALLEQASNELSEADPVDFYRIGDATSEEDTSRHRIRSLDRSINFSRVLNSRLYDYRVSEVTLPQNGKAYINALAGVGNLLRSNKDFNKDLRGIIFALDALYDQDFGESIADIAESVENAGHAQPGDVTNVSELRRRIQIVSLLRIFASIRVNGVSLEDAVEDAGLTLDYLRKAVGTVGQNLRDLSSIDRRFDGDSFSRFPIAELNAFLGYDGLTLNLLQSIRGVLQTRLSGLAPTERVAAYRGLATVSLMLGQVRDYLFAEFMYYRLCFESGETPDNSRLEMFRDFLGSASEDIQLIANSIIEISREHSREQGARSRKRQAFLALEPKDFLSALNQLNTEGVFSRAQLALQISRAELSDSTQTEVQDVEAMDLTGLLESAPVEEVDGHHEDQVQSLDINEDADSASSAAVAGEDQNAPVEEVDGHHEDQVQSLDINEDADSASSAAVAGEDQNIEEEGELEEEQQPVNRVENRKRPREDDPDSPQPGPSCSRRSRFKRGAGAICIDSTEEDELTEEQKNKINEALESDFGKKHLARVSLYEKLSQIAGVVTGEQELTPELEEDVKASIRDMSPEDLKAIEPGMKPIILRLKSKIESGEDIKPVFKEAGVARKISSAAEGAGAAFTVFLVGKHLLNGDVKGLGYDALNLYVMPKIGQKIAEHVGKLGAKLDSATLRGAAPVLGRAVGNFAAFLGLYQSIKARQSATDPVDKQIADLNIATNSIFIAADMPAIAAEIGVEAGIESFAAAANFAGPIGSAVGVAAIIIAQFVEAGLEVKKIAEHISLTAAEKNTLYWHFFDGGLTGGSAFAKIEEDIELKEIYTRYIENIARDYDHYKNVVISLPQVVRENHYDRLHYPESLRVSYANNTYGFSSMRLPQRTTHSLGKKSLVSSNNNTLVESRLLPSAILNGTFLCGLSGVKSEDNLWANRAAVVEDKVSERESWTQSSREIFIGPENARYVPAICKNNNTESAGSFYYLDSNTAVIQDSLPSAHVVFTGQDILFGNSDVSCNSTNRFFFSAGLNTCSIYTGGINFFYTNYPTLNCYLAGNLKNFVVHRGNFTDSSGIDAVIGSQGSNYFTIGNAKHVDGMGGNDVIDAKNFTIIQSYPGDTVLGKGMVLLPFNLTEISVITYNNSTYVIKSNSWSPISVDGSTQEYKPYHLYNAYGEVTVGVNSTMQTRDGFFITPMRHENGAVTDLQVSQLVLHRDNDTISNFAQTLLDRSRSAFFNLSRHFQSDMTDYIIADKGRHVFYPEKNGLHYWQAGNSTPNLYLTECGRMGSVLVSKANGVLDLSCADADLNIHHLYDNTIYFYIGKKAVAALVNGIGDLKIKFPGERYYDFYSSILDEYCELHVPFTRIGEDRFVVTNVSDAVWMGLNRDYCSHNLEISGRQVTDANHLSGHYNCFSFDSDKVFFLKSRDSLLLASHSNQLLIEDYYSVLHQNWDISIKTPSNLIKPTEFADLASNAHTYKYYKPLEEQKTRIFHNQPNRNQIGFVDLSDRPITDFKFKDHHVLHRSGKVTKNDLKINCNREKIATIKNWNTSPEVRKMIFAFSDAILFNCIFNCTKEAIYRELREKKLAALEELQSNVTTTQLPSESTTAPTQTREKRDVNNEEHLPLSSSATRSTSFLGNAIGVLKNALFMSSNWFLGKETQASRITKSFIRCSDVHFVTHPSSKMHSANSPIALISPSDQTKGRDIGPAVISAAAANTLLAHCMASAFNWRMTQHERTQQIVQFAKDTEIPVKEATDGIKRSVRKLCYGYGDKELASINSLFTEHFSKIKDDLRESVKIEGGHGLTSCAKLHKENFKSALSSYSSKCAVERIGGIPTWLFAEKIESATSQGLGC